METIGKLIRYKAINEAYSSVLSSSGEMAQGLSKEYIYSKVAEMTCASKRTIQRALKHRPITADLIDRMRH